MRLAWLAALFFLMTSALAEANQSTIWRSHVQTVRQNTDLTAIYELNTDLADRRQPRLYNHTLGAVVTYIFSPKYEGQLSGDFRYYSLNQEIPTTNENLGLGDLSVGLLRRDSLNRWLQVRHKLTWVTPTSDASRYEGYRSLAIGSSSQVFALYKRQVQLINSVSGQYIFNSYRFSPVSQEINPDYAVTDKLNLVFTFWQSLQLKFGTGIKMQHYIDGTRLMRFNNSATLAYIWRDWAIDLNYLNGSYADQGRYDLWYIDRYRQNITASVSYAF